MNFTELYGYRARTLAFITSHIASVGPTSGLGWKGYALRIAVFAVGFGIYVLLFRRKASGRSKWSLYGNGKTAVQSDNQNPNIEIMDINDDEICPICLGVPKIGVKASCGHLLCAECLVSYCDVTIKPAPLPCPLCRAPLNSIALACDIAVASPKTLDPNVIMITRDWIREYNNRNVVTSVRPLLMTRLTLFINILVFFFIVGLIAARLQVLAEI